jgi:hypothetical protein
MRTARRLAPLVLVLPCVLWAAAACGPSTAAVRAQKLAEGREKLAEDPSAALQVARNALLQVGPDPELELLAADACLALGRRSEALTHADQGLAAEGDLPDALAGDLSWVKGFALVGRFRDLHVDDDWRAANTILERAAESGNHRAEAAFLLVALQDLGSHRDDERQLKYARRLQQLEPEGQRMTDVRAALEKKGLTL